MARRPGIDRKPGKPAAMLLLAAALATAAAGIPAEAGVIEPVPMPRLRPAQPGDGAPQAAGAQVASAAEAVAPRPEAPAFTPRISSNSPFNRAQQTALAYINNYFSSFRTMEGQFVQVGPNGEQSEGVFFLSRPGKIRFHYKPPVRLDIISDGSTVAIENTKAQTQDMYPLSKTPLRYLLAENIDLTSPKLVSQVIQEPDLVSVVIVESSRLVEGKLTLMFDTRSYELKQWIVTDAQGLNTSVAVYNVTTGKQPDPKLFRINLMRR